MEELNIDEIRSTAYATHEEAKAIVKRINAELDPVGFCPLRNNICRKDCVCFQPAFIQRFEAYHITGFMCDNKMFFGK